MNMWESYLYSHIYCSPKVKLGLNLSTHGWINKMWYIYIYIYVSYCDIYTHTYMNTHMEY
jgi:hypothetical protein